MMTEKFEIIRKCLETTYSHVTFVKSAEIVGGDGLTESITTVWTVGEFGHKYSVTFNEIEAIASDEFCAVDNFGSGMSKLITEKLFKNNIKKVENKMIKGIELNVLRNGVRVLENGIKNDLEMTQNILNKNKYARDIDASCAYVARDYTHFENTYEVQVQRMEDYRIFSEMLENEKCINIERPKLRKQYNDDELTRAEYYEEIEKLELCKCEKCDSSKITFEAWKTGTFEYQEYNEFIKDFRIKSIKLGKHLKKLGYKQEIIDFYSAQVKDEKTVYLTITSAPQFIAGMSYFAKPNSFNGYNGTSCQDTRHQGRYPIRLGGALADNMLHIAFMHESLEDLNDMTDKMKARVLMRPIEVDSEWVLVPTKYYGNVVTKDMLHYALNQLNEVLVYSTDITDKEESGDRLEDFTESVDDGYEIMNIEEVNVCDNDDYEISCDCPVCDGEGEITREVEVNDCYRDVTFDCPVCDGSGTYETTVTLEYDEYIDVETEEEVFAYNDEENHFEFCEYNKTYTFTVNATKIRRDIEEYHA